MAPISITRPPHSSSAAPGSGTAVTLSMPSDAATGAPTKLGVVAWSRRMPDTAPSTSSPVRLPGSSAKRMLVQPLPARSSTPSVVTAESVDALNARRSTRSVAPKLFASMRSAVTCAAP